MYQLEPKEPFGPREAQFFKDISLRNKYISSRGIGTGFLHIMSMRVLLGQSFEQIDHMFMFVFTRRCRNTF